LLHQTTLKLGTLHAFALATERTRANGLRRKSLLGDLALPVDLAHRLVDHRLLVRVHEGGGFLSRTEPANAST
jgi:hypothetical protein